MTILVMVALTLFGIASYFRLPISDLPSVDYPVMTISVGYPGASPATMASTVASPLENECMQIPGLQSIISDNTEGQTTITLTFDLSRNVDLAAPDVQAAISRAQSNLPTDLPTPPSYSKNNPSESPIIYLVMTSDTMRSGDLYDYGNRSIGKQISMINGVSQVQVWGAKNAMRVRVDPERMSSYGIGIDEVAQALKAGTVTIPAGSLNGADRTFSIEPEGQLYEASEYNDLIIKYVDGSPVRVKDIGEAVQSVDNDVVNVMFGSSEREMQSGCVVIAASRQAGANTVAVAAKVKDKIDELKQEIPGSANLKIFYDQSVSIIESVKDVKTTILIALCLVVLVIFLFIGRVSDTVIPAMVLPIAIISTFILMLAAGFSLNNLSLMALTLSVGFLVDDAIVVLENTVRHVEAGIKPLSASMKSMDELTGTVISTSVSLIVVFVPLVFMGGVVGRNFKEFAMTVIMAITCSTLISLTLTPMMCARMLTPKKGAEERTPLQKFADKYIGGMTESYGRVLKGVLKRKYISVTAWAVCIAGIAWLFSVLPKTFIPEGDSGAIMGQMVMQQGTSTKQIRELQDQVNYILRNDRNVDNVLTITGMQTGADQSTGIVYTTLKDAGSRAPMPKVVAELQRKLFMSPLGFTFIQAIPSLKLSAGGESTATGSKYSYTLKGNDRDKVYETAEKVEKTMKGLKGFTSIQSSVKLNMPQLKIKIFRDRASTLGISAKDIEYALSLAYAGGRVTTYKTDTDQYDVILELSRDYSKRPEDLAQVYVRSSTTGELVPLGALAEWEESVGPQSVPHSDQLNSATLSFSLEPGVAIGNAIKDLNDGIKDIMPPDISGTFEGEAQEFEEAVASLGALLLVAVFIMYVILGILYESYIHPFTVLTTLPVAMFGGLATLFIFRSELSLYAYIGIFMLLGIVAKNGIMMVDFANQNMDEKGMNSFDAIHDACLIRFRPILMTGVSSIVGALPIALGFGADGSSRMPLGLIIVGGLAFAQVVTLFVTPGFFLYMQVFQEKFLDRFELTRSVAARKHLD
ncbi:MAG: acriflavine resistance protein B [Candidatus Omnitrophica bacterium]|nr:acriflavine resistance protein B [Candidatus Omnitrophota bacterium]